MRVFKRVFYLHRESTERAQREHRESTEGDLDVDEREIDNIFFRPTL